MKRLSGVLWPMMWIILIVSICKLSFQCSKILILIVKRGKFYLIFRNNKDSSRKKWSSTPTLTVNCRKKQLQSEKNKGRNLMAKIRLMETHLEETCFIMESEPLQLGCKVFDQPSFIFLFFIHHLSFLIV